STTQDGSPTAPMQALAAETGHGLVMAPPALTGAPQAHAQHSAPEHDASSHHGVTGVGFLQQVIPSETVASGVSDSGQGFTPLPDQSGIGLAILPGVGPLVNPIVNEVITPVVNTVSEVVELVEHVVAPVLG